MSLTDILNTLINEVLHFLRMPSAEFTVADVKKLVGARRKVDVIDTLTQDSITMSLGQWTKYYETFPRQRLLNIISLEISCTKLDHLVEAPAIVSVFYDFFL